MRLLLSGCTATLRRIQHRYADVLGMLVTPSQGYCPATASASGLPWAIDNAAFSGFDERRFRRLLSKAAGLPGCLFTVAPDVVADARATLATFPWWVWEIAPRSWPVPSSGRAGAGDCRCRGSSSTPGSSAAQRRGSCRRHRPTWSPRRSDGGSGYTWGGSTAAGVCWPRSTWVATRAPAPGCRGGAAGTWPTSALGPRDPGFAETPL